tara:strand:+ start:2667 stop:2876 length:210 start_codon:yes stop_codon:yes gene_type:complete
MSFKLERDIVKLRKELHTERARINWIILQLRDGMTELAVETVSRIIEENIEAEFDEVELSVDEQLKRLL